MTFDLSAVGTSGEVTPIEWTPRDAIVYALGVGAGQSDPLKELQFTTENSQGVELQVLPAFGIAQAMSRSKRPDVGQIDRSKVLHGEQSFEVFSPLPTTGAATLQATVAGIYDQGSSAHIVTDILLADAVTGVPLLTTSATVVVRGAGGFGGVKRESSSWERPSRDADVVVSTTTRTDQALLYRLSGDRNPLHSDPTFAQRAGFDRPILHGLCTFGITGRNLINELCGGDATLARGMGGRFSKPVRPGETLTLRVWSEATGHAAFVVENDEGQVVLDRGTFSFVDAGDVRSVL
ncbi:MAG: MaoC/PaaZ C-terminal domain-containing protein [bacterium]|nr:MaoC/PaaZ C-terminal domain-containing protein [bacterium]